MKALENRKADPKIAELRKTELPAAVKDTGYTPRASLASALDVDPEDLPPGMVQRFDEEVKRSYGNNGNMEISQRAAADRIKKTFLPGRSTVGGVERFVEYAPEAFLAQTIPNAKVLAPHIGEAITAHLTDTLKALPGLTPPFATEAGKEWEVEDGLPPIKLEASPTTRKQIAAGARPEYDIYVRDIGGWRKLQDEKGNPVTYPLPDHDTLMAYPVMQTKAEELKAKAEGAASRRKAVGEVKEAVDKMTLVDPEARKNYRDTMRNMWGIK